MHRVSRLKYWARKKKPREGQSNAKSCRCLSDHFHRSGHEGRVCDEFRLRKIGKDIKDYRVEVTFPLELDGLKVGSYRADFVVDHWDGTTEVVEAKGIEFAKFKRDWKVLLHMNRHNHQMKFRIIKQ